MPKKVKRCFGDGEGREFYAEYHDNEWGVPVYDDRLLFEMLCLEGAQAGLSWETVLKKRAAYKKVFIILSLLKFHVCVTQDLKNFGKTLVLFVTV